MLLDVKTFEILPKYNGYGFILDNFALNWYIVVGITNEKLLLPL